MAIGACFARVKAHLAARSNGADHNADKPVPDIEHASPSLAPLSPGFETWCKDRLAHWKSEIRGVHPPALVEHADPVLDADTALIDGEALARSMSELVALLPPMPADATKLRRQRHDRLRDDLERIGQLARRLKAMPDPEQGTAVRHAYARAARSARQLAHNLDGSRLRRWKPEPELATAYAGIAAMLGALKDRHRSAAAGHIAERDARREAERLSKAGWRQGHAGDSLVTGTGASVTHMGAPLAGGGFKWQDWRFNDDDSKMYYVEQFCAFAEGGLGGELEGLKAKLAAKVASQFGTTVLMSLDQVALAKLVLNHHANRAAFTADGPRARAALARLDAVAAIAQRALGKHYVPTPAAACLGDARLAKGVNSAKLELIAETIDAAAAQVRGQGQVEGQPDGSGKGFKAWLGRHYPSLTPLLRERVESGQPPPKDMVQTAVGTSMVYAAKALGQHNTVVSGESTLGYGQAMEGEVEIGATAGASYGPLHFFFALPRAAHELLDPAHTRDLRQTLAMHAALEKELGTQPVMALYRQVASELDGVTAQCGQVASQPDGGATDTPWPPGTEDVLGARDDVPASFHRAVARPHANRLEEVTDVCETLREHALALVEEAELLRARPSRQWPAAMARELEARRRAAFERLAARLFPGGPPPCSPAQALAQPEAFIARCHDALSLALARAQTQRWLLAHGLAPAPGTAPDARAAAALAHADAALAKARAAADAGHLGLTKRRLTKDASVQAHATYQRHEVALKVALTAQPPAPASALANEADFEAPLHFSVHTSAGRLAFTAEVRWQKANYQINPARLGEFMQITFKAEGGAPLLGDTVREVALQALCKRFPGTRLQDLRQSTDGLPAQMQGLVLDVTDGASVVVKLRQAPGVGAWDLQFVRGLSTATSGIDTSAAPATASGVLKVGVQSGTTAQTTRFAAFGPCLGNLGMQMVTLEKVLAGLDKEHTLTQCFDTHPHAKTMYFGLPGTVPTVLQRFIDRELGLEETNGQAPAHPLPNEFHRFYDEEPFARIVRTGPALQGLKPGQGLAAPAREPVSVTTIFEQRGVDWEQAKRHIATLRTPDERLAWYAGEGRPVFDAFLAVMRELDMHTAAFIAHGGKGHHGFVMSVNA